MLNAMLWQLCDSMILIKPGQINTLGLGPKKYQKIARMYDQTGLSTKCTLMKTSFKNLCTGTEAKFRPFVDALLFTVD